MQLTFLKILAIGGGGFLGAVSRYLLATAVENQFKPDQFPMGIAVVNILGCFLIGILAALFELKEWMNVELRMFVFAGLLGGFTTFSTLINDTFLLGKDGEMISAFLNVGGQVIVGLLFVWLGYFLVRMFT
jgi:CrcB protein